MTGPRRPIVVTVKAGTALVAAVTVGVTALGVVGLRAAWVADRAGDIGAAEGVVLPGAPEGTVPSVFAHTRASATELLEDLGLSVRFGEHIGCELAGRPVGTEPATGTPVDPGDTVTVLLSRQGPNTDCTGGRKEAWQLMDFATGHGPAPSTAAHVEVFVDGRPADSLPSALRVLSEAVEQVVGVDGELLTPSLQAYDGTPPDVVCGSPRPAELAGRSALSITIALPVDSGRCPARLSVYRTGGTVDVVAVWTARHRPVGADEDPVPDVVGMSLAQARDKVTAAGFTAHVEQQETCRPRDGVVEQAPTQQALEEDFEDDPDWTHVVTLVVEVPHTTRDCDALDAAADAFVGFAQGGPPPAWAPEVQQLVGYDLQGAISAEEADDSEAWTLCPDESLCDVSPLSAASGGAVEADESRDSYECEMADLGGLPSGLGDTEDQITLFAADPADCSEDWTVELWIDDAGAIRAVNLLLPRAVVGGAA